jgi:O-acetyl-ADP-ribose deacetylase (regulator of RNase III)
MKIRYEQGDFVEGFPAWLLHGCNAQGVMGSGAAKAVRAKYPQAYTDYRKQYEACEQRVGTITVSHQPDGRIVFNGITQKYYGRDQQVYVSYDAVRKVIQTVDLYAKDHGIGPVYVGMPKIGAGLGGGSWDVISQIIEEESRHFTAVVYEL